MNKNRLTVSMLFFVAVVVLATAECSWRAADGYGPRRYGFREMWGYLMKGEERRVTGREPLTDILYFGVSLDPDCRLLGSTEPPSLPFAGRQPRLHLVLFYQSDPRHVRRCMCDETSREILASEIAGRTAPYAGVQVDFESLGPDDAQALAMFMASLRDRLPGMVLSVAVPAQTTAVAGNAYDYAALAAVCDRIFVMAYDQHWNTARPGPVASLSWCAAVAGYAVASVPRERLVMGLPLYGRAWQDPRPPRSLTWEQARELSRLALRKESCPERGASFEYWRRVKVKVFFEDIPSIHGKLRLYDSYRIPAVAFWRIGQGPPGLWDTVILERP